MPLDSGLVSGTGMTSTSVSSTGTADYMWDMYGDGGESGTMPDIPLNPVFQADYHEQMGDWPVFDDAGGAWGMDEDAFLAESPPFGGGGGGSFFDGGGGGGGGGGAAQNTPINWVLDDYNQEDWADAPSWFRPMTITDESQFNDPRVSFTLMANAMIGSGGISEEDSRSLAKQLYGMWGGETASNPWDIYSDKFDEQSDPFTPEAGMFAEGVDPYEVERLGIYADVPQTADQAAMGFTANTTIDEKELYSGSRGMDIVDALSNARELTVGSEVQDLGPGYQYLQNLAGESRAHAGEDNFMTRAERQSYQGAMDPLIAQSQEGGALGSYGELARMIGNPFFTNMPTGQTRLPDGSFLEGERNSNLSF